MRKYGKWALTLGLMAATPGLGWAAPWSKAEKADPVKQPAARSAERPAARPTGKVDNQKKADEIAVALRNARLQGYDIEIEYKDGVATLKGRVTDPKQKEKATQVISRVPGVSNVENQLVLAPKPSATDRLRAQPSGIEQAAHTSNGPQRGIQQAAHTSEGQPRNAIQRVNHQAAAPELMQQASAAETQPASADQAMAEQVGAALSAASFDGYDIEVRYKQGVVILNGAVKSMTEREAAQRVVSQVPGVLSVQNNLRPVQGPAGPQDMQMAGGFPGGPQAGYPAGPPPGYPAGPMGPVHPAAYQGAMGPGGAPIPMGPGVPAPPGYGHPGAGASQAVYNQPYMPEHAWPAYAQYPNYAAVQYPSQYSASAWPYIGPFYPYPQVPLGWRDATLRWDDGQWSLQFRQRTDKWFWFMAPKNW